MGKGWLDRLRSRRRGIIHWVVAALVLPLLIGILPQSGLSAASALDRDLEQSICSPFGNESPAGDTDHQGGHHQHCILCASGCSTCGAAMLGGTTAVDIDRNEPSAPAPQLWQHLLPVRTVLVDGSPPRGPPSFLLI